MNLIRSFSLPEDVVSGFAIVHCVGNKSIIIENFKAIMEFNDNFVKIKAKKLIVLVQGKNLSVDYYNSEEIKVTGKKIESIYFEVSGG